MGIEKEVEIWYAMRATYRREPDAMRLLKKENLGCFIPMQYKICIKKGKKVRALVPVVHNLLFVHARPSDVQRVKSQVTYLHHRYPQWAEDYCPRRSDAAFHCRIRHLR